MTGWTGSLLRTRRACRNWHTPVNPSLPFIHRDAFDGDGSVYHAKVREVLYREPPLVRAARRVSDPNLADLRKAMADAHPDRGGNRDDFQQARASYLRAKQRAG